MNTPHQSDETDPQLDALLSEALSPQSVAGGVPDDLTERILAATQDKLAASHPSVLARIGSRKLGSLAAAAALVAASVGIVLFLGSPQNTTQPLIQIETDMQTLADYTGPNEPIDHDIQLFETELEMAMADTEFDLDRESLENDFEQWDLELDQNLSEIF